HGATRRSRGLPYSREPNSALLLLASKLPHFTWRTESTHSLIGDKNRCCPWSSPLVAMHFRGDVLAQNFSDAAIPEIEIALDVHGQERIVIWPRLILGQFDLLLSVSIRLVLTHRLLHRSREILQIGKLVASIVLRSRLL